MNREHMMVLVQANREMEHPERFTMETYVHNEWHIAREHLPMEWCGTPACLLGNFGARSDLQPLLCIKSGELEWCQSSEKEYNDMEFMYVRYSDPRLLEYFDITEDEAADLLGPEGCDGAKTRDEALDYVESMMKAWDGTTAAEREL